MRYTVVIPHSVQKQLNKLPDEIADRIIRRLVGLETEPHPPDVKKLRGREAWRIRVGNYRVIYENHERGLRVVIVTIGHRREIYR